MATDLEVQEKKEVVEREERTVPAKYYVPPADIHETDSALSVVLEMPGVEKENVTVQIDRDVLKVEGRIDFSGYADTEPLYTEYNVGHYARSFSLSSLVDRSNIGAKMNDGVLTLTLHKKQRVQPRQIQVN